MKAVVFANEKDDFFREVVAYMQACGVGFADTSPRGSATGEWAISSDSQILNWQVPTKFSIVLGGDGTVLAAARKGIPNPILVINTGHLGFLTSTTKSEWKQAIDRVVAGDYTTTSRSMLDVFVGGKKYLALNDVVIAKDGLSKLVKVALYTVTGGNQRKETENLISEYRADGLIISTPTGSTAYNLSAGGPIIHPDCDSFVVAPICPQGLTQRPLVLPSSFKIRVKPMDQDASHDLYLSIDGQIGQSLHESVTIHYNAHKVEIVNPLDSYFQILRTKLGWGIKPV